MVYPRHRSLMILVAFVCAVLAALPLSSAAAQTSQRCFTETGYCIEGRIREFWEKNGGLPVFGYPIGPQQEEQIEGKPFQVQHFERNRLELHPENAAPYDVLLGRLGVDRLAQQGRDWQTEFPQSTAQDNCRFFAETGHNVCGEVLTAWRASGLDIDGKSGLTEGENLALFGLPLSDLHLETQADGVQRQVQWFERARFEIHPENQAPYNVLLGLLGNEIRDGGTTATVPSTPTDPCASTPDPVNARIRPAKCVIAGTDLELDIYGFTPNEQVGFWLTDPNKQVVAGTQQTLSIGPTGEVDELPLYTDGLTPGLWYFVFEGVDSKNQSIVYFTILNDDGSATTPVVDTSDIPASQNASATPASGGIGTEFSFVATGFKAGEKVGVYATAPDQSVYGAPFQVEADDSGNVTGVTFYAASGIPTGVWALTFEGTETGHKAIAFFKVTS